MIVDTAVLGPVDVEQENIFHLPNGLYGFEGNSEFALITKRDDDVTLMWFQSVSGGAPCFVVFDPFEIIDNYQPVVEASDLKALGCKDSAELSYLVIAVVPENISEMTVNLKSPIVINKSQRKARQVILANRDYPIRYALFPED